MHDSCYVLTKDHYQFITRNNSNTELSQICHMDLYIGMVT